MYDNHPKMKFIYVGIDCHKLRHTAGIINCFNEKLDTLTFKNKTEDFEKLIKLVDQYAVNGLTPIYGLEDTKHLGHALATFLLAKNLDVRNVVSTLTFQERKKFPIISKSDELDALCIAKVVLDNLDILPKAKNDELYWTLKQIMKMRKNIVFDNIKAKNKLHSQLLHHYPYYQEFFSNFDCTTALEFWERFPCPKLMDLTINELTPFLYNLSRGRFNEDTASKIYNLIHNGNYEHLIYQEERNILIVMLVKQIKNNLKQLLEIEKSINALYDKLDCKLHTIKGLTKITSAEIIANIGNIDRFSSKDKLARYAGIAPVSFSSGNNDKEIRNEYGNRDLNSNIYNLAVRSIIPGKNRDTPSNAIFLEYYLRKIRAGKTKKQAITCIMRRLINIIYIMLRDNTEFVIPKELELKCKNLYLETINKNNRE